MNEREFTRIFSLPFAEASRFFRDKLTIETEAWDELSGKAHAKAFTSAGAYQAELLTELRRMTDKAIAGGMDIREFRKQFLPLVERYGWQLKGGGAAWRSDLIWRTNIATSYQAGRWQQFQEAGIEYLRYDHKDGQMNPRPNHMAMDGMILPVDDPFWSANYPPNGWRCHCRAVAARKEEYEALPEVKKTRPENWAEMADNGWRYNVGQAGEEKGYAALTGKLESLPNDIAREWMKRITQEPAYERFLSGKIGGEFPVAVLPEAERVQIEAGGQVVWLSSEARDNDLAIDDYRALPEIIDLGDRHADGEMLRFVLQIGGITYSARLKPGKRTMLAALLRD